MVVPFEPRRFRSAVPYYARFRVGYPDDLIRMVARLAGVGPEAGVLDLGCGPGVLAIPLARLGARVVAVDPEPEMLDAARQSAAEAGVRVDIRPGSSYDLPRDASPFRLVVMGRSFHFMAREETLRVLDGLVEPQGALALFGDRHPETRENAWLKAVAAVAARFGADDAGHRRERRSPEYRSDESLLLDSPFAWVERHSVVVRRSLSADDLVGRSFSRSVTSKEALGDQADAFEASLRSELRALSPSDDFTEIVEVTALVARRPPG